MVESRLLRFAFGNQVFSVLTNFRWDERIGASKHSDLVAQDVVQMLISKLPESKLNIFDLTFILEIS